MTGTYLKTFSSFKEQNSCPLLLEHKFGFDVDNSTTTLFGTNSNLGFCIHCVSIPLGTYFYFSRHSVIVQLHSYREKLNLIFPLLSATLIWQHVNQVVVAFIHAFDQWNRVDTTTTRALQLLQPQ